MAHSKHDWELEGVKQGSWWYRCKKCGKKDWIPYLCGDFQLRNDECIGSKPDVVSTETKPCTSTQEIKQEITTLQEFDVKLKEMLASLSAAGCDVQRINVQWAYSLGKSTVLQTNYDIEMLN